MAFKGLRFAGSEIQNSTASKVMKVVLIAISIIPLLYGALYLMAFLDPYKQLNTVPVAVVNEDQGAEVNGQYRTVGDELVNQLKDNDDGLGWQFVSADQARAGLENGTYYMTCTIPSDFTQEIASADTDSPEHAEMIIDYNQAQNMLASQIGQSVWKEVRSTVSDSVSREYWNTVFDKVNDGADQVRTAADGATTLKDGLTTAQDGSSTITTNLQSLTSGSSQLTSGLNTMVSGTLALKNGTSQLTSGASQVATGATQLQQQGTGPLASGASQLAAATASLPDETQAQQLVGASQQIAGGMSAVQSGIGTSSDTGNTTVYGLLYLENQALSKGDTATALVINGYLSQAVGKLSGGLDQTQTGYSTLSSSLSPLVQASPTLKEKIAELSAGASQVDSKMSTLASGANSVASGAQQLDSAASQLQTGASSAADGSNSVTSGAQQLTDGSASLTSGLSDAISGSDKLATGLSDGADGMSVTNADAKADVMNDPVQIDNEYYTTVKNYGTGFAPYFISLGLWVGALMASFVFKPLNKRLILSGGNPAMTAFANYIPLALIGIVQSVLLMVVLQFGLNLQIDNVPLYYAFGILTALVFAAIMQLLMAALGFPGKFLAIIFLMLQLTSAAGTFPIEQTPAFFQAVSPYMPMTYVVAAMRQIMTGMDLTAAGHDAIVLICIGGACFLLTMLTARAKRIVRMDDLHPVLKLG
jgi:putative membrane protein